MKMKHLFILILILVFTMNLAAQHDSGNKNNLETNQYKNATYNFSFEIPDGWVKHLNEDSKIFAQAGKEALKPNKSGETQLNQSLELTQTLLMLSKFPVGTPDNASLVCAVEQNPTPDATIEASAIATQNAFVKNFGYTLESSAKKTQLGNRSFMKIKLYRKFTPEITLYQTIYLRKAGNKVLQFVLSYTKSADGELMEKSLKTLEFKEK
jgi:hypothetical protein